MSGNYDAEYSYALNNAIKAYKEQYFLSGMEAARTAFKAEMELYKLMLKAGIPIGD